MQWLCAGIWGINSNRVRPQGIRSFCHVRRHWEWSLVFHEYINGICVYIQSIWCNRVCGWWVEWNANDSFELQLQQLISWFRLLASPKSHSQWLESFYRSNGMWLMETSYYYYMPSFVIYPCTVAFALCVVFHSQSSHSIASRWKIQMHPEHPE